VRQATIALPLSVCIGLGACGAKTTTINTVDRADAKASAIVEKVEGDATVSTVHLVSILGKSNGEKPVEVLKMDKGDAPQVVWLEDGSLSIAVPCGQIYSFKNFTVLQSENSFEKVSVRLQNDGLCAGL
jgi:hypothetical protein